MNATLFLFCDKQELKEVARGMIYVYHYSRKARACLPVKFGTSCKSCDN